MPIAVLYPRFDHPAIEERYASWQTQMLLRAGDDHHEIIFYDREESGTALAAEVDTEFVLVVTDPLLVPSKHLAARLRDVLVREGGDAALPVSNEAQNARQQRAPIVPYLTLRELQDAMQRTEEQTQPAVRVTWEKGDPAVFLCRTETLATMRETLAASLNGREVAISPNDYIHRWSSLRGQTRFDLLTLISPDAKSILEFGCGEGTLGEALKRRQKCRVVGIELDAEAAAIAQKRIDSVYRGDVREIVTILDEQFDWIVGGDIVEHLDEPWSFLDELRRITKPGGHLLLSLPNLANASVISDLLQGRFDYVYMGLTCVGHVRFFTKQSIEDMLSIAGWSVVEISPQHVVSTSGREELLSRLDAANVPYSKDDLLAAGYYVIAQNS
ncbi:MAG TPA: class I SAM-dependent methyltransferase [Thermoanaerobaculia bacterium]|nr:class I SAM-dependent methyltransferase [Thermoanaerobaculia bacterium]